jgi:hypothetical protein
MCLNKTCRKVRIGKHLSDNFRNQNSLKQGDDLSPLLLEGLGIAENLFQIFGNDSNGSKFDSRGN